jgi:hypothetical protein
MKKKTNAASHANFQILLLCCCATAIAAQESATITVPSEGSPYSHELPLPTIFPYGGDYRDSVQVSISVTAENATIYYTIDGTAPTVNSLKYSEPFVLKGNATVKTIAVRAYSKTSLPGSVDFRIETLWDRIILAIRKRVTRISQPPDSGGQIASFVP